MHVFVIFRTLYPNFQDTTEPLPGVATMRSTSTPPLQHTSNQCVVNPPFLEMIILYKYFLSVGRHKVFQGNPLPHIGDKVSMCQTLMRSRHDNSFFEMFAPHTKPMGPGPKIFP